jgi:hypothetical protein
MWEHGTLSAEFAGQMASKVARILDKITDRDLPWQAGHALHIIRSLEVTGHLRVTGAAKITKIEWIGQTDPNLIDWEPPKPERQSQPKDDRLARAEARIDELQAKVDRIPEQIRQAVDLALEAWTR